MRNFENISITTQKLIEKRQELATKGRQVIIEYPKLSQLLRKEIKENIKKNTEQLIEKSVEENSIHKYKHYKSAEPIVFLINVIYLSAREFQWSLISFS